MKFAIFSILLGMLAGIFMPGHAFKEVATGMLTLVGIVVAAIVPAMALTISTMRASNRSVREVRYFRQKLSQQLTFWLSFLAVVSIIAVCVLFASIINWPTTALYEYSNNFVSLKLTLMTAINATISCCLVLIIGKALQFARGIEDLLNLHMDQVEAESLDIFDMNQKPIQQELETKSHDPQFGKIID